MVFGSIFIVLAVGILAFAYITNEFGRQVHPQLYEEVDAAGLGSGRVYQQKLYWLKELEIEYETGKIEASDYLQQKEKLQNEALEVLTRIQAFSNTVQIKDKDVEEMIQDRRMERVERSAGFCVKCGSPLQRSDLFCSSCGSKRPDERS